MADKDLITSWRTVKVFISSTFRDMQAERDHLVRFVFPKLREELLARRIHLVDVDLRWGVTGEQDALSVCREIIDECHPRFLCMLGGRYGWVPPGENHSITADEIHYGVLNRLGKHGYAFFYFRDPKATNSIIEEIPGEYRELSGSENEKLLDELKKSIISARLKPFIYSASWDNNSKRMIGLKKFGDRVYKELKQSIDHEFGEQPTEKPNEFLEARKAIETFIEERCEYFVLGSRESVLKKLLAHSNTKGGNSYLCITGSTGSGKSALLAHFYKVFSSFTDSSALESSPFSVIGHFVGISQDSTNIHQTLRRLCYELKRCCSEITAEVPDHPEKLRITFLSFLRQACVNLRIVIIIDAVDQFDIVPHSIGLHWLPDEMPDNARIILSSLKGKALEELRSRNPKPLEIHLEPLTQDDSEKIIENFSKRYHKKLTTDQRSALKSKIEARTPLYLLSALEELRTFGTYAEINHRIAEIPSTADELFEWILERLTNDNDFRNKLGNQIGGELVPLFGSFLGVSRHGLSQRELIDLIDPGDEMGNVASLLKLLRPYLMHRGELIDFYHRQFRSAALRTCLKTESQRQDAHLLISQYFQSRQNEPYERALSELPYHLAAGGLDKNLMQLTSDVDYLEKFVNHYGAGYLLECLKQALAVINHNSSAALQLKQKIEILESETSSLIIISKENRVLDFCSQLVNGALRQNYHSLFRRVRGGFPGCILLQWALGSQTANVKQWLAMPGNRENYSWDSSDYGPCGCESKLWIDLSRCRLLTDTISTYGSVSLGKYEYTHEPMEWDLESGILLIRHNSETYDDWAKNKAIPEVFEDLKGLTTIRQGEKISSELINLLKLGDDEKLLNLNIVGKSVNSDEMVLKITLRKTNWIFGSNEESLLWVYDPVLNYVYRTSFNAEGINIQAIVKIESHLTIFATDRDKHLYRLLLCQNYFKKEELPVLDFALSETHATYACVRSSGIEIRSIINNEILQVYTPDDLTDVANIYKDRESIKNKWDKGHEFKKTPDNQWFVTANKDWKSNTHIFPIVGGVFPSEEDVFSVLAPRFGYSHNSVHDATQVRLTTRLGKYYLVKNRCSIDIYEGYSMRYRGSVGPGLCYGGGGNLYGFASHPNERFVISSDDLEGGGLMVWDLDNNFKHWRLKGLGPLGKIKSISFIWGGHLVVALTEDHFLYILRFWHQSEILGAIRVDQTSKQIIGMPYGDRIFVLYENGRLGCYKYFPREADSVTTIEANKIHIRFHSEGSKKVNIAGTFNNWSQSANPLRTEDGVHWQLEMQLPKGRYEYKIVIDGSHWELDPNVPFVPREYGPNNYFDLPSIPKSCQGFGCRTH